MLLTTGCSIVNPHTKILEDIRHQNIEGIITAYETAFQGMHIDYIENTTNQYKRDKEHDLLISAYQIISGKTPEEIKQEQLFSISEIQELNTVYEERTKNKLKEIENSFIKFYSVVNESKITIKQIENKIEELKQNRENFHNQIEQTIDDYKKEREDVYKKLSEAISGLSNSKK